MFFIFDMIKNFWMEKWNQALGIMGWQGITIKWTDCILGKDNYEQKVSEAIKNRISKFYRIDGEGNERIRQIKQALCSGNPVVFGTKVTESFRSINSDNVIYNPNGGWIGAHAMVIVSWSEEKQAFEVRNSWGENWGVQGYCWIDKNYIASNITRDIWVPTI
jgi:C1A family cysteine protease